MDDKECGFCKRLVAGEAKLCPDCGYDFEPKQSLAQSQLTDAQLSALLGFESAKADLADVRAPKNAQQIKIAKMAKILFWVIVPTILSGLVMEHLGGNGKGGFLEQVGGKVGQSVRQQRENRDLIDSGGKGSDPVGN